MTHAAVHDSQVFDVLLDTSNTSADLWADSAYRSEEREADLKAQGYRSHIQTKGTARKPFSERAKNANHRRAKVRARVEHVFAAQTAMGGMLVRTIGFARARVKIAMMNIVYNLRRVAFLHVRCAAETAEGIKEVHLAMPCPHWWRHGRGHRVRKMFTKLAICNSLPQGAEELIDRGSLMLL